VLVDQIDQSISAPEHYNNFLETLIVNDKAARSTLLESADASMATTDVVYRVVQRCGCPGRRTSGGHACCSVTTRLWRVRDADDCYVRYNSAAQELAGAAAEDSYLT
jgi:hypothetical protein